MDNSKIGQFWKGYVSGTNRGKVKARITLKADTIQAKVILEDQAFGPAMISLVGKLTGENADIHLIDFCGLAPLSPLDGRLTLKFENNFQNAQGAWGSDIGTSGNVNLHVVRMSLIGWWTRLGVTRLRIFWLRRSPLLYTLLLLAVVILDMFRPVQMSYHALILLLIPAPYVFRKHLSELIQAYRVRKIGPVELDPQPPMTPDVFQLIHQQLQLAVQQQVYEAVAFLALDWFLVLRTKQLLIWLSQAQRTDLASFNNRATSIGVPSDNVEATLNAIVVSGCATITDGTLAITDRGRRYVNHLLGTPN